MESGDSHKRVTCPPSGTDNSQQQSTEADVDFQDHDCNQSHEPVFYLEPDDDDSPSGSREDATEPSTGTKHIAGDNNCNSNKNSPNSDRETIQAGAAITKLDPGAVLRSDGGSETLREADCVWAASAEDPRSSSPRTIPPVQRAHSSPLTTVCRSSHSHLVVRCQVNSHDLPLPHPSTSCPAAFSPVWPLVVPPVPASSPRNKTHSKPSAQEQKRRHTVGSTTPSAQQLQHLQRMYGISNSNWTDPGSRQEDSIPDHRPLGGTDDVQQHPRGRCRPQGRERSMSDSELQFLMMKEMGKLLRLYSDEFNNIKTGKELTPVEESGGSEESSDDDVN